MASEGQSQNKEGQVNQTEEEERWGGSQRPEKPEPNTLYITLKSALLERCDENVNWNPS